MNEVLIRLLVDQLCFLELSGDDTVSVDAAVQQFETVVSEVALLAADDRRRLAVLLGAEATRARVDQESEERVEFIETLPDALGLLEEDDEENNAGR